MTTKNYVDYITEVDAASLNDFDAAVYQAIGDGTTPPTTAAHVRANLGLTAAGGATLVGNTPAGNITATTVQAALNELDSEKAKVGALASSGITGAAASGANADITSLSGLTTALSVAQGGTGVTTSTGTGANVLATSPALVTPSLGVATATTATSNDSSTKVATTAFVNPANSLATNGYQKFASGLIIQWGIAAVTTGTPLAVTFPIAFTTNVYAITLGLNTPSSGSNTVYSSSFLTSGVTLSVVGAAGISNVYWMATGI